MNPESLQDSCIITSVLPRTMMGRGPMLVQTNPTSGSILNKHETKISKVDALF
jgi:hypothetical protein